MQLSDKQTKVAIGLVLLVVIGLGYLLWSRSASPEPTPLAGQSIKDPMGTAAPQKMRGAGGAPGGAGKRGVGVPPGTP